MFVVNQTNTSSLSNISNVDAVMSPEWRVKLELAVSIIIIVVGIIGNFLVLLTLKLRKAKTRPPYEYFIGNLSIADLIFIAAYLIGNYAIKRVTFLVCLVLSPLVSISATVSMYTVTAIAIFRSKAIVNPFQFKPGRKTIYGTIAGIWVGAHVIYIPLYLTLTFDEKTENCGEIWPSQMMNKVYTVTLFVVQYPIPLTIIAISYTTIVLHLKRHNIPQENDLQLARKRKQDKEVLKISVIIVILYTVLTLPSQILWISLMIFENPSLAKVIVLFSGHLLLCHCCCNPLVYGSISRQFRTQIDGFVHSTICICCPRNRKTQTIASPNGSLRTLDCNTVELTAITIQSEICHGNCS